MKMTGSNCVLDTSIIIHAFKNSEVAIQLNAFSEVFVSSVAVGELYYGAYRSGNVKKHLDQIRDFLLSCTVLNTSVETAELYGRIKTDLKSKGKPIPENDIWIAAIASQYNLPLFTADKHFKEIDKLTLFFYNPE